MPRYIDAEYMFKCETCRHYRENKCNTFCDSGESYSPNVSKIPTADVVEVKHGYWVHNKDHNAYESEYFCSVCLTDGSSDIRGENYCYNCGAKMDGGKQNDV